MKKGISLILCLLFLISLTGCIKTYTYQAERKDQDIRGNRGVIMGKVPPPEIGRKRTRTMGAVDVKLPPTSEYKKRKKALEEESMEEPITGMRYIETPPIKPEKAIEKKWMRREEIVKEEIKSQAAEMTTYTVKKGDSLQKIAKTFLGKSSRWPEIYEANKDTIKDPSKIYPGQVIAIPQGVAAEEEIK